MKKLFLLGCVVLATAIMASAQSPLETGGKQLNAGVGLSGWGVPIYVGLDYGIYENITVGGEISFRSYHDNYSGVKYNHSIIGIMANGNYHFNELLDIPSEWDLYAGLNLGYFIWRSSSDYTGTGNSGIDLSGQIGGRYFFKKNLALSLEFSGGNSTAGAKLGITYKF